MLDLSLLLPPAKKLEQGNIFRSVCQEFCPQGMACMAGGHVWQRGCVWQGGMYSRGHEWWGCAWWGCTWWWGCVHDRVCAWQGGMHGRGACVVGVCAWQGGHTWHTVNEQAVRILLECILVI